MHHTIPNLKRLVGEMIIARIPTLHGEELSAVKLHAIEAAGIWIESQRYTDSLMERCNTESSTTTPLLFIPFAKIDFILASVTKLALSEKAFGLGSEEQ